MANRLSNTVRREFVDYFTTKHGHKFVRSSPVKPEHDRSLSFVNAGMNQFKPLFLADRDDYQQKRVCNYQKCIRVGGKTCDLDSIGHDLRHHTFFEMLGNWSFNDYGKEQACEWALDFLTDRLKLDRNKLLITYFSSDTEEDSETRNIWLRLGISKDRLVANRKGENFWEMGPSGPCGLSTEIFYPIGDDLVEIWNLVFIDRHRVADSGEIKPLRNRFVDTGMGLERILSVLENVNSNYDTDLFRGMFKIIESRSGVGPYKGTLDDKVDIGYRILADHSRMITVALADGIEPGRSDAPFYLRSIIKRAILISRDTFNQTSPRYLIFDLVDHTVDRLSLAYPELANSVKNSRRILARETKRYLNQLKSTQDDEAPIRLPNLKKTLSCPEQANNFEDNRQILTKESVPNSNHPAPAPVEAPIRLPSIKEALRTVPESDRNYIVSGRVLRFRAYAKFNFVDLVDGLSRDRIQVVLARSLLRKPEIGSYLICQGRLIPTKQDSQILELRATEIHYHGECDPQLYPLANKYLEETPDFVHRRIPHLRPRVDRFGALLRVRSELELAIHMIMKQMDFLRVHTPILSSNDSEASSDLFAVNRSKIAAAHSNGAAHLAAAAAAAASSNANSDDYYHDHHHHHYEPAEQTAASEAGDSAASRLIRRDYFDNKEVFLVTSAQLHLETLAAALSRVYTISSAFRAERSLTRRHLCEFTMFELEESNLIELEPLMDRVESIIKFVAHYLSETSEHRSDFSELVARNSNELIFDKLARAAFIRMSYEEALDALQRNTSLPAELGYGADISRTHEKMLLDYSNNVPIFITNYPKKLKPFYMKTIARPGSCSGNLDTDERDDSQVALCFDLIAPHGGEICGGSLREDSLDRLAANLGADSSDRFSWYLDTRRFGSFPHGGFGIGIERLLQSLLGVGNIKDTLAFPRYAGNCPM